MGDVYTLLSAAVLACDVARHPSAVSLADTLDRVLALTPSEASRLGPPAPDQVRRRVLETAENPPRVSAALTELAGRLGTTGGAFRLRTLDEAVLGTLEDLHGLLRRETPLADASLQVALDAVTVAWSGPHASLADREALTAPWRAGLDPVPPALPETAYTASLRALLDEVARRRTEQWERSVASRKARRAGLGWSTAVHEACTAALQADRLRDVARAQLAAARALGLAHTGVSPYAVGMVVTAAVQATCTADLLDERVVDTLLMDWAAGS